MPLTRQVPPHDPAALTEAAQGLSAGHFAWALFTSGNAVRALHWAGWDGTAPENTRLGVVGPGTAEILEERTRMRDPWMPRQHSAAGILDELPPPEAGARLLLPQSAQARPALLEGLRSQGWDVTGIRAYETVPLTDNDDVPAGALRPQDLGEGDIVLITSSSAARGWAARQRPGVTVLAIGEPTASTLRVLEIPAYPALAAPTAQALIAALESSGQAGGQP